MRLTCFTFIGASVITATSALADGYSCASTEPEWELTIDDVQARFIFPAPTKMDVPLITTVDGREWPIAYTLVGERDTAIVLLDKAMCDASQIRAHVLTQRAELPILLTGCCTVTE